MQYNHAVQPCARYCHPFPCRYNVDQYLLQSVLSGLSDLQVEFPFKLSPAGGGGARLHVPVASSGHTSTVQLLGHLAASQQHGWHAARCMALGTRLQCLAAL